MYTHCPLFTSSLILINLFFSISAASQGDFGSKGRVDTPMESIANKENLYSVSANRCDTVSLHRATTQSKTTKRGERSGLRKSLAWNQAFFTDEGALFFSRLFNVISLYRCFFHYISVYQVFWIPLNYLLYAALRQNQVLGL